MEFEVFGAGAVAFGTRLEGVDEIVRESYRDFTEDMLERGVNDQWL